MSFGPEFLPGSEAAASSPSAPARPRLGIILGSGLGAVAEALEDAVSIPYTELPGLPGAERRRPRRDARARHAVGRAGRGPAGPRGTSTRAATRARCAGRCGRSRRAGAEALFVTNAAGSLRRRGRPGLADGDLRPHQHARRQPADRARTTTRVGPRFPSLRDAYDPELRALLHAPPARSASRSPRASTSPPPARASRRPPRSARSARSAPTRSACRRCRRSSSPATPACGSRRCRRSPTSPRAWAARRSRTSRRCTTPTQAAGDLTRLIIAFCAGVACARR